MLTNMKTAGIFAVMFCCFAVLYPKIFHPMVVHIFGLSSRNGDGNSGELPRHPREMNPNRPMQHPPRNPTMRGGVHPGMRAAAEMRKQASEQGGSNKGVINLVLPMYAVGIVIYLVYTMAKVFMRNKDPHKPGPFESRSEYKYRTASSSYTGDHAPYYNYNQDLDEETRFLLSKRDKLEELEQLLAKAELKEINDNEMVTLRQKLEETECQMSRILKAMEHVQSRVKDGIDAHLASRGHGSSHTRVDSNTEPRARKGHGGKMMKKGQEDSTKEEEKDIDVTQTDPSQAAPTDAIDASCDPLSHGKDRTQSDLNALDSESSGTESDDERSDESESQSDSDYDDDDDESGIRQINGIDRLDLNSNDDDVIAPIQRQFDDIPGSDSDDVIRGDVLNDVGSESDVDMYDDQDDGVDTLGPLVDDDDTDMGIDTGLRQRKIVES